MGTSHKLLFCTYMCIPCRYMCMQFPSFDPLASSAHEASFQSIHEQANMHTWLAWISSCAATCFLYFNYLAMHVFPGPLVCEASIINNKIIRPGVNHIWITRTTYAHASRISFSSSCVNSIYSHAPDSIDSCQSISALMLILYPNTNSRCQQSSDYIRFTKIWCQQFRLIFACETNLLGFELDLFIYKFLGKVTL